MPTLIGTGFIEVVPMIVPGFAAKLSAEMAAGTKLAGVKAAAEAEGAGALAGRRYVGGMRGSLGGLMKAVAAIGIADVLFKVGSEFDKAYDNIRVRTGATGAVFEGLKTSLKNVAVQSSSSIGDIGTAMADLNARTGQTGPGLETLTRQMLALSSRMGGDLRDNIRQTTRLFGDWSISTKDQSGTLDFLFKAAQKTGVGISDLEEKVVFFGAPLRQFGFSFQDAATMLAKWEKEGVNITTVLAGMRMGLGNLTSETKRAAIEKDLGIKISKDPKVALVQIEDAIKHAGSAAEANHMAFTVFGKRAGPDMAAAIREGRFDIKGLEADINRSGETILGTANKVVSFQQTWARLKNILKVTVEPLAIAVFNGISEALKRVVGPAAAFAKLMQNNKDVVGVLVTVLGILAATVLIVNTAQKAYNATLAAYRTASAAATASSRALGTAITFATGPIGVIIVAIAALVAAVILLWTHWDQVWNWIANHKALAAVIAILGGPIVLPIFAIVAALRFLKENWGTIWNGLKAAVQGFVDFFVQLPGRVVDFFVKLPGRILDALKALPGLLLGAGRAIITGLVDGITAAASMVWDFFTKLPGRIMGFVGFALGLLVRIGADIVKGLWNGITTAASMVWDFFTKLPGRIMGFVGFALGLLVRVGIDILKGLANGIVSGASAVWNWFKDLPGNIKKWIVKADVWLVETGKAILHGIWNGITTAAAAVWNWFKDLPGNIKKWIIKADTWLVETGKAILRGLRDGLIAAVVAVANWFKDLPGNIKKWIIKADVWLVETGKDVLKGFLKGIWEGIKDVGRWIKDNIIQPVIDGFKHGLGISSPSTLMVEIGKDLIRGFLNGMLAAAGLLWDFIKGIPGKILDLLKGAGSGLLNAGKSIVGGLVDGIKGAAGAVGSAAKGIVDTLLSPFTNKNSDAAIAKFMGSVTGAIGGVRSGMAVAATSVGTSLGLMVGSMGNAQKSAAVSMGLVAGSLTGMAATAATKLGQIIGNEGLMATSVGNATGKATQQMTMHQAGLAGLAAGAASKLGAVVASENSMAAGVGAATGKATQQMTMHQAGLAGLAAGAASKLGAVVASENVMAAGVGAATGKATQQMTLHEAGLAGLAAMAASRLGAVVASEGLMATGTEGATNRVNTQTTRHTALMAALAAAAATHMGQIVGSESLMATGTEGATNRVNTQQIRHIALMAALAAAAATHMGQIIGSESSMAAGTEGATNRVNTQQTRHIGLMATLAAAAATHMGQIIGSESLMATGTEGATTRVQSAAQRHIAQMDTLQANVATRMGQIVASALNMASNTEATTGRAIGAFIKMQGSVDSLHGKDIKVTAGADVTISQHVIDMTKQLGIAFAAAEGGFLPSQATIAQPVAGRGLVQWAEPETGGEAFIPLAPQKRKRSVEIWQTTGKILGQFAGGGLLNINLPDINSAEWLRSFPAFQSDAEGITTKLGQNIDNKLGAKIGTAVTQKITDALTAMVIALQAGAGGGSGQGVANAAEVVAYAKSFLGDRYGPPYYDPSGFSCDGFIWYVFKHFGIGMPTGATNQMNAVQRISEGQSAPGDVVGFHQNGPSGGNPLGLEFHHIAMVTGPNQQIAAANPAAGVCMGSISGTNQGPGAYVRYGRVLQNLNPGWSAGAAASAGGALGAAVGGHFTQGQIEAAMRIVGASASVAHIFSAIAMNENPASTRVSNSTGTYDSVFALQEAWTIPMGIDINRLNTDIVYAAGVAYNLYKKSGFTPWEAYTNGNYRRNMAEGGILGMAAGGVVPGTGTGDTVPAMLQPKEFVMTKAATAKFLPLLQSLNAESGGSSHPRTTRMGSSPLPGIGIPSGAGLGMDQIPTFSGGGGAGSAIGSWFYLHQWIYFLGQWHQRWWWNALWAYLKARLAAQWRLNHPQASVARPGSFVIAGGGAVDGFGMLPAMLTPGEYVMGPSAAGKYRPLLEMLNRSVGGTNKPGMTANVPVRSFDRGGMMPPGLSLAWNGTGRPEQVGGGAGTVQNNTVTLTLNVANGDPVTMRAAAQQVVDDALTALSRRLSSGAGRN
jgi:cell wall-associated NlpC family hydrolase